MHQLIIIVGAMLCFVSVVRAQSLTGTVLDPQGGGVPNAQVRLYVRENGVQLNATSDSQGKYRFPRVTQGEYVIEAEAEGFARTAAQSIQLELGRALVLDIPLKLDGVAQEIVVTAAGSAQAGEEISKAISTVGCRRFRHATSSRSPNRCERSRACAISNSAAPGHSLLSKRAASETRTRPFSLTVNGSVM